VAALGLQSPMLSDRFGSVEVHNINIDFGVDGDEWNTFHIAVDDRFKLARVVYAKIWANTAAATTAALVDSGLANCAQLLVTYKEKLDRQVEVLMSENGKYLRISNNANGVSFEWDPVKLRIIDFLVSAGDFIDFISPPFDTNASPTADCRLELRFDVLEEYKNV